MKSSQSFFDEFDYYITPSELIEFNYCKRFTYYMKCLNVPQFEENRFKVQKGKEIHSKKENENKQYLRKKLGVIDKKIKYGIKRFPGVFTKYRKEEYISINNLDKDIIDTVNNIILIKEYKEAVFMRIDFILDNNCYKVMEVELVDPNLFIETINDSNLKDEVYKSFVKAIKTRQN